MPPMLIPQLQTKTPIRGDWPVKSVSGGRSLVRVMDHRTSDRLRVVSAAEADASITEEGISLGS